MLVDEHPPVRTFEIRRIISPVVVIKEIFGIFGTDGNVIIAQETLQSNVPFLRKVRILLIQTVEKLEAGTDGILNLLIEKELDEVGAFGGFFTPDAGDEAFPIQRNWCGQQFRHNPPAPGTIHHF
jgi:hypothetical protein